MNISELNYLETVNEESGINGAGGVYFNSYVNEDVNINKKVDINIWKDVNSKVKVHGNLATAEGSADAYGKDTLAEVDLFAQTTDYSSEAYGLVVAATGTHGFKGY